jgi:N-acetyltransferase
MTEPQFAAAWSETPLEGQGIVLRPLVAEDAPALVAAAADGELWTVPYTVVPGPQTAGTYVATALAGMAEKTAQAFVVVERASGVVIGSSRLWKMSQPNRKLEIGHTWIARRHQGTRINPEMKLLMLQRAFEALGCVRVQLQTDERNLRSQAAIEKLGAVREGVLRHERIMPDGFIRNSVRYSIVDSEWPGVKAKLLARLEMR